MEINAKNQKQFRYFVLIFICVLIVYIIYAIRDVISLNSSLNLYFLLNTTTNNNNNELVNKNERKMRIFCIILTIPKNFDSKTRVINQTWAKDCDKYIFVAKINNSLPINDSYEYSQPYPIIQPEGYEAENYNKLTDKVYRTMKYIYQKYNYFDWYLKADDDTFIFMDNLRDYLETKNTSDLHYYGYSFRTAGGYNHGGGGYVIGKEAFHRLGSILNTNYSFCPNSGIEDLDVGQCLKKLGVEMAVTLDEKNRERFHIFNIVSLLTGNIPKWIHRYSKNEAKKGIECCSEQSISFHYMKPDEIEKLYGLWIEFKKNETIQKPYNITPLLLQFK